MKHKALFILAVIFCVLALGLFYVNKVLLPVQLKGMIIKSAQDALHRKVTFDDIRWGPLKGLAVTNFTVYSPDDPAEVFVHIEKASAQILFFPLFNKKVIIPWAAIDKPSIRLVRLAPKTWNFSDLLKPAAPPADGKPSSPPDFLVGKLLLTGGRLKIVDNAQSDAFSELIEPINVRGSISVAAGLHLTGNITLPETKGQITFDTRTGLKDGSFKGALQLTKVGFARYARFIPDLPANITSADITEAALKVHNENGSLAVAGEGDLSLVDLRLTDGPWIKASLKFEKASFSLAEGRFTAQGSAVARSLTAAMEGAGSLEGDLKLSVTKLSGKGDDLSFAGSVTGEKLLARLDGARNISGDLRLTDIILARKGTVIAATAEMDLKGFSADLAPQLKISGEVSSPKLALAQDAASLKVTGDLKAKKFLLNLGQGQKLSGEMLLKETALTLAGKDVLLTSDVTLDGAHAAFPGVAARGSLACPRASVSIADDLFNAKLQLDLKNGEINLPEDITFRGSPSLNVHLSSDMSFKNPEYAGTLILEGANLSGLPTIGRAEKVQGKLIIATDRISTKNLTLNVLATPVTVSGEVRDLAKPYLDINASASKVDLALAEKVVPQVMKDNGLTVTGTADISVHISGLASKLGQADIAADARLYDASVTSEKLKQDIQKINGTLKLTTPTLSWKDLSFLYQGRQFVLNGYLKDFENPYVATALKADDIAADLQLKKTGDTVRVESFSGAWFDSSVNASGRIDLAPDKGPLVNFVADGKVSLRDLSKMVPQEQAKDLEKLNLSGVVKVNASAKGDPADWPRMDATVSLDSAAVYAMGYRVNDLAVKAVAKDGMLDPLDIKANVYGGALGVISSVNLTKKTFPFEAAFKLADLDIGQLKNDTPLRDRELAGMISSAGELKGSALDLKSLEGKTNVEIVQGRLLEVDILSKLLSIVSASFQGGDMVITDASALFDIAEGRIMTNNLTLQSPAVTLLGEGWMDLDQNIDLNITPRLETSAGATGTLGVIQAINPTTGLLNIHITGTVTKPQFNHNVSAPTMIKKTLQNTVGNILKIFE